MATSEALGLAARGTALHVNDLPVAKREHLEALVGLAVVAEPSGRADDLVVAYLDEIGLDLDSSFGAILDLELEDLTGLIGAASGRRAFPPQEAMRDAAPLGVFRDQRGQRFRVTLIERFGSCAQLIDHGRKYDSTNSPLMEAKAVSTSARVANWISRRPGVWLPDLSNYDLVAALREPGCPLCRVLGQAEVRAMDAFVHERGQAAETQRLFSERGGFCREHAWLHHRRSALALTGAPVAQVYERLLRRDIARLERLAQQLPDKPRSRRSQQTLLDRRDCPACERAEERLADKAAAFVLALRESKVQASYEVSDGLCVQHLDPVGAEALTRDSQVAAFLIGDLKRRLELLKSRLDEYERKRDYRFAATLTEADSAAWTDVVRSYVGDQFNDA